MAPLHRALRQINRNVKNQRRFLVLNFPDGDIFKVAWLCAPNGELHGELHGELQFFNIDLPSKKKKTFPYERQTERPFALRLRKALTPSPSSLPIAYYAKKA
jgi:hypothetical protein